MARLSKVLQLQCQSCPLQNHKQDEKIHPYWKPHHVLLLHGVRDRLIDQRLHELQHGWPVLAYGDLRMTDPLPACTRCWQCCLSARAGNRVFQMVGVAGIAGNLTIDDG